MIRIRISIGINVRIRICMSTSICSVLGIRTIRIQTTLLVLPVLFVLSSTVSILSMLILLPTVSRNTSNLEDQLHAVMKKSPPLLLAFVSLGTTFRPSLSETAKARPAILAVKREHLEEVPTCGVGLRANNHTFCRFPVLPM